MASAVVDVSRELLAEMLWLPKGTVIEAVVYVPVRDAFQLLVSGDGLPSATHGETERPAVMTGTCYAEEGRLAGITWKASRDGN